MRSRSASAASMTRVRLCVNSSTRVSCADAPKSERLNHQSARAEADNERWGDKYEPQGSGARDEYQHFQRKNFGDLEL